MSGELERQQPEQPTLPGEWHRLYALAWQIFQQARAQGDDEQRSVERVIEALRVDVALALSWAAVRGRVETERGGEDIGEVLDMRLREAPE